MTGAITWEQIAGFTALAGSVGGLWWFLQKQITAGAKALDEYKLYVSDRYIKAESLQKLEERLLASEARMIASIEGLGDRIDRLVDRMPATKRTA
ncbi:hypothetical protein [Allomesorhizobium alhagi]|uniref:Uncharacterized protein n=1 Tax=Mesorhizobium alhagi CCNWXJ12-2 TaxID=1107882 RepID=H0HR22_9HYPH|nr:hypothetical protein [Mesorhizobium alhagi]EHK56802.1 hypothetical protein MAXJ12_13026 [Mesorhizobium alhagi CCNWXJ12-2]